MNADPAGEYATLEAEKRAHLAAEDAARPYSHHLARNAHGQIGGPCARCERSSDGGGFHPNPETP